MDITQTASSPPAHAALTMVHDPVRAFAQLEVQRNTWFPLLALMAAAAILTGWYFSVIDHIWLNEQTLATVTDAAARERAAGAMLSPMVSGVLATVVAMLAVPVGCALSAVYLLVAGKVSGRALDFKTAFSLSVWSSLPLLLLLPLGAMQILLASSNQFSFESLNPLSLNHLVFQYPVGHRYAGILDSLSVTTIWSVGLTIIGYQCWTRASRMASAVVVLLQYLVIYGIWFAYAMSQPA